MGDFVDLFIKVKPACSCANSKFFHLAVMLSMSLCSLVFIVTEV